MHTMRPLDELGEKLWKIKMDCGSRISGSPGDTEEGISHRRGKIHEVIALVYGVHAWERFEQDILFTLIYDVWPMPFSHGQFDFQDNAPMGFSLSLLEWFESDYQRRDLTTARNFEGFTQQFQNPQDADAYLRALLSEHAKGLIGVVDEEIVGEKWDLVRPYVEGQNFGKTGGVIYSV